MLHRLTSLLCLPHHHGCHLVYRSLACLVHLHGYAIDFIFYFNLPFLSSDTASLSLSPFPYYLAFHILIFLYLSLPFCYIIVVVIDVPVPFSWRDLLPDQTTVFLLSYFLEYNGKREKRILVKRENSESGKKKWQMYWGKRTANNGRYVEKRKHMLRKEIKPRIERINILTRTLVQWYIHIPPAITVRL